MIIGGFQKTSMIDYPNKIASIVFCSGCNFKCGYCHNPSLFESKGQFDEKYVLDYLKTRVGKIDAVVISGGEATLQKDLEDFIKKVKKLNYLVKLDTNGSKFDVLKSLVEKKFVDYVALDVKSSLSSYAQFQASADDILNIRECVEFLKKDFIDYEFRSTLVKEIHTMDELNLMANDVDGAKRLYLQKFNSKIVLNDKFQSYNSFSCDEMLGVVEIFKQRVGEVFCR